MRTSITLVTLINIGMQQKGCDFRGHNKKLRNYSEKIKQVQNIEKIIQGGFSTFQHIGRLMY